MLTIVASPTPAPGPMPDRLPDYFDVRAVWDALTDAQRTEIGVSAIILALGAMAMDRHLDPFDLWDTAVCEGQDKLEAAVVAHVIAGSTTLPRPDLAAIGVRSCERCGCTDDRACIGGCFWVAPNLCSACVKEGAA